MPLPRVAQTLLLAVTVLAMSPLQADDLRGAFAWQWPIQAPADSAMLMLTLEEQVYARVRNDDLSDLVVLDGNGEPVPFGPVLGTLQRAATLQPAPVPVPMFAVPRPTGSDGGEGISLQVARGSDGRLTQLTAGVDTAIGDAPTDLLLDLSALEVPVQALLLTPEPGALQARVSVQGSDDLDAWQALGQPQAVLALEEDGMRIERLRLELPHTGFDYLRLRRLDARERLPLQAVAALPAPVQPGLPTAEPRTRTLEGTPVEAEPRAADAGGVLADGAFDEGAFEYHNEGPLPVDRVDVRLADRNAISEVVVQSRPGEDVAWQDQARFTAFRLSDPEVANASVLLPGIRDRHWRVLTRPAQQRPPSLVLGWRPERFLMLAQGEPPYRLAAGSARMQRNPYPVGVALARVQAQRGADWQPPEATLGDGSALAGDAALAPPPRPVPVRQWLLWSVLVAGAAAVLWMVLRLLQQRHTPAD